MDSLFQTDVQCTNFRQLSAIRLAIEADKVAACFRFAMDAELATQLQRFHLGQLISFVSHVGINTLFPPRDDLLSLLSAPAALVGPLAAARTPRPTLPPPER